jgi:hypothetical protein
MVFATAAARRGRRPSPIPAPLCLRPPRSHRAEHSVEWLWNPIPRGHRLNEQSRVPQPPAGTAAREPPRLRDRLPGSPGRLALQGAERVEVTLAVEERLDVAHAHGLAELVLQVQDASEEAGAFQ